jgi:hypothetical protein
MANPTSRAAGPLDLLARWAWVAIPLAWGIWQTVRTSLALFE